MPGQYIAAPTALDITRPLRDLATGHPLVQERWPLLKAYLEARGFAMFVNEVYRYHARQQWLYGAGRTAAECRLKNVPVKYARPKDPKVTNASSALLSAHGFTLLSPGGVPVPAAAALDVVPLGPDGKPYTKDDPWPEFLAALRNGGYAFGLVHFAKPGRDPWDLPHLQLVEWSDAKHTVML